MSGPKFFFYAFLLILLLSLTGCGLIGKTHQKKVEEEKKIIGYAQKYNPRATEIQQLLKKAGFNPGAADGVMGSKTRSAIRSFQKANELKVTGFIDSKTWAKLNTYIFMEDKTSISLQPQKKFEKEIIDRTEISFKGKEELQDEVISYRLKSSDRIKNIQRALTNAGFDPGPIDGKLGAKTKKAIADFQRANGLTADGVVGQKTWKALNRYLVK